MNEVQTNLTALLGSRICHDLISPIGAIHNGLELLAMTAQGGSSAEMILIEESCRSASARIRFFRVAFGVASQSQRMGSSELRKTIADFTEGSRLNVQWTPDSDTSREEAQMAFLALLCTESALPHGGQVRIDESGGRWKLTAEAANIKQDEEMWHALTAGDFTATEEPALVHFCLLHALASAAGRAPELELGTATLQILV